MTPELGSQLSAFDADEISGVVAWMRTPDGSLVEAQADASGAIVAVRDVSAADVAKHESEARRYLLPTAVRDGLHLGVGADVEAFLEILLRDLECVHLWTRLGEDGAQRRAVALVDGGVLRIECDRHGRLSSLQAVEGFGGLLLLDLVDKSRERLAERNQNPVSVASFGAAYAHARSAGSGVVAVREDWKDRRNVRLVCEAPQRPTSQWFPHMAGGGNADGMDRFTRAYRIADRSNPDVAYLGEPNASGLASYRLSMLLTALTHPGRPGVLSASDHRLAVSICHQLLARIAPDRDVVEPEGEGGLEARVRERRPDHFARSGLNALLAEL